MSIIAALTSLGCRSMLLMFGMLGIAGIAGAVFALMDAGHIGGTLSYGLGSCGLLVLSRRGDPFRPRLTLRRRSAARENRPVILVSFSLRPRLWLMVEFLVSCCVCRGWTGWI